MQPIAQEPGGAFATASLGAFRQAVADLEHFTAEVRRTWDILLLGIQEMIAAIRRKLQDSWFGDVFEWFTADIADGIRAIELVVEEARVKVSEMLRRLEGALNGSGPVLSLFTVGIDWQTQVNTRLSKIIPSIKQSGGIDNWEGPANRTYRIREGEQELATSQVSEGVKEIGLWLTEVGVANTEFITQFGREAGAVIEKVVEVTADVAVVAGSGDVASGQEAVNDLASTIGRFASNLVNYLASLGDRLANVTGQVAEVAATHSDYRAFPGGHWPLPVQPTGRPTGKVTP